MSRPLDGIFDTALETALGNANVRFAAEQAGLGMGELKASAKASAAQIWRAVAPERERFEKLPSSSKLDPNGVAAYESKESKESIVALSRALTDRGFLPFFHRLINESKGKADSDILSKPETPDLAHIPESFVVESEAGAQLHRILMQRPGGVIAISGPSGVGKTTLMRWACSLPLSPQRPSTGVVVEAPQEGPREFVLDLFAALCRQVARPQDNDVDELRDFAPRSDKPLSARQILSAWPILILAGCALIILSLYRVQVDPKAAWGTILLTAGIFLGFYDRMARKPMLTESNTRFVPKWARLGRRLRKGSYSEPQTIAFTRIQNSARALLQALTEEKRFQRTFTSGSSVGLKFPVGLEAGRTGSVTLTQLQRRLPDIVEPFRNFVTEVVNIRGPVVIGVDGLDEIESGEDVHHFLRSIRPIFGLYLFRS